MRVHRTALTEGIPRGEGRLSAVRRRCFRTCTDALLQRSHRAIRIRREQSPQSEAPCACSRRFRTFLRGPRTTQAEGSSRYLAPSRCNPIAAGLEARPDLAQRSRSDGACAPGLRRAGRRSGFSILEHRQRSVAELVDPEVDHAVADSNPARWWAFSSRKKRQRPGAA